MDEIAELREDPRIMRRLTNANFLRGFAYVLPMVMSHEHWQRRRPPPEPDISAGLHEEWIMQYLFDVCDIVDLDLIDDIVERKDEMTFQRALRQAPMDFSLSAVDVAAPCLSAPDENWKWRIVAVTAANDAMLGYSGAECVQEVVMLTKSVEQHLMFREMHCHTPFMECLQHISEKTISEMTGENGAIKLHKFGSWRYRLAVGGSDCDVVIVLKKCLPPIDFLKALAGAMNSAEGLGYGFSHCSGCHDLRVTMGNLQPRFRGLEYDISVCPIDVNMHSQSTSGAATAPRFNRRARSGATLCPGCACYVPTMSSSRFGVQSIGPQSGD